MTRRPTAAPAPLTPQHLADAFARHRRPGWPATLPAALEHPLYRGLVRLRARQSLAAAATPSTAAPQPAPPARPGFDWKRAAAADYDE